MSRFGYGARFLDEIGYLDLSRSGINAMPKEIELLTGLRSLILDGNVMVDLSALSSIP